MRSPRTLKGRLSLAALSVGVVGIVVLTAAFNVLLEHVQRVQVDNLLRDSTHEAQGALRVQDGHLVLTAASRSDLDSAVWVFQGTTLLDAPTAPQWLQDRATSLAGTDGRFVRMDHPRPVALHSAAVRVHGQQLGTVVSAISVRPYERSARAALAGSVVLAFLLLLMLYMLTRSLVRRALAPVFQMTDHAREWSAAGTAERFGEANRPTELEHLAHTLDDLLDRLSAVLRREQRLTAEISHELRTPLAAIVAETDLFAARPRSVEEAAATVDTVAQLAARMNGILETLLSTARAPSASGRSDALAAVTAAVTGLGSPRVPVVVDPGPPGLAIGAEQALTERALAPLLANAVRHAATEVRVRLVDGVTVVRIEVADDGQGVPAEHADDVFEPGYQLDVAHGGAGLGLPLARRLARAAGGDVRNEAVATGALFVLELPAG